MMSTAEKQRKLQQFQGGKRIKAGNSANSSMVACRALGLCHNCPWLGARFWTALRFCLMVGFELEVGGVCKSEEVAGIGGAALRPARVVHTGECVLAISADTG